MEIYSAVLCSILIIVVLYLLIEKKGTKHDKINLYLALGILFFVLSMSSSN